MFAYVGRDLDFFTLPTVHRKWTSTRTILWNKYCGTRVCTGNLQPDVLRKRLAFQIQHNQWKLFDQVCFVKNNDFAVPEVDCIFR